MYHSCSPLDGSEPPLSGAKGYFVVQVPDVPFQRLSELNSSPNVRVAVPDRFLGSIVTRPPSWQGCFVMKTRVDVMRQRRLLFRERLSAPVAKAEPWRRTLLSHSAMRTFTNPIQMSSRSRGESDRLPRPSRRTRPNTL